MTQTKAETFYKRFKGVAGHIKQVGKAPPYSIYFGYKFITDLDLNCGVNYKSKACISG